MDEEKKPTLKVVEFKAPQQQQRETILGCIGRAIREGNLPEAERALLVIQSADGSLGVHFFQAEESVDIYRYVGLLEMAKMEVVFASAEEAD